MINWLLEWAKVKGVTALLFFLIGSGTVWAIWRVEAMLSNATTIESRLSTLEADALDPVEIEHRLTNLENAATGWNALDGTWLRMINDLHDVLDVVSARQIELIAKLASVQGRLGINP